MVKIAPSVLSADFAHLKEDIDTIYDGGKSWIHYDVMDGHFVPNISFGYSILSNLRAVTDLFIDVHLMITDPGQYLDEFINAGALHSILKLYQVYRKHVYLFSAFMMQDVLHQSLLNQVLM